MWALKATTKLDTLAQSVQNSCWSLSYVTSARRGGGAGWGEREGAGELTCHFGLLAATSWALLFHALPAVCSSRCMLKLPELAQWVLNLWDRCPRQLLERLFNFEHLQGVHNLVLSRKGRSGLWWKDLRRRQSREMGLGRRQQFCEGEGSFGEEGRVVMLYIENQLMRRWRKHLVRKEEHEEYKRN